MQYQTIRSHSMINGYHLTDIINNKEDWHNASLLAEKIWQVRSLSQSSGVFKFTQYQQENNCKILLTTFILLAFKTEYPNLLTVRTLLLLSDLKARFKNDQNKEKITIRGSKITNHFFIDGSERIITPIILSKTVNALDNYLGPLGLSFTDYDFTTHSEYLERIFPLPLNY